MLSDLIYEKLLVGGWVLLPIFLVGVIGFYILIGFMWNLGFDLYRRNYAEYFEKQSRLILSNEYNFKRSHKGLMDRLVSQVYKYKSLSYKDFWFHFRIDVQTEMRNLERGMLFVSALATASPMLGLLGTVTGMIETFEVINKYGTGNPALMARGIAEALIATQAGLLIALPMIIWKSRLEDRLEWVKKQMEMGFSQMVTELYPEESDLSLEGAE